MKKITALKDNDVVFGDYHQSEVINAMRFPLIVMIVLFHFLPPEDLIATPHLLYNIVATFFSAHGIARLAVPAFFLISGHLFFYHLKIWNKDVYVGKLRKRVHSLLIPYLLWNVIPFVIIILIRFILGLKCGNSLTLIKEFGDSVGWMRALWDSGVINGHPFDVPLWFVRDLMVCSICSPIIYLLIKKLRLFFIISLGCLYATSTWIDVAGFDSRAWFFFSFGAYFSINKYNMVCLMRRYVIFTIPFAVILFILTTYFSSSLGGIKHICDNLFLFFGNCALIGGFSFMVSRGVVHNAQGLTKSVFFVYAFHAFPLPVIVSVTALCKNLTGIIIVETNALTYFIQLVICPMAILGVCLAVYYLMSHCTSRVMSVLIGQR